MSDGPDWLTEPAAPQTRPLGARVLWGAVRLGSLLLGVVGVALAVAALVAAWQISGTQRQRQLTIDVTQFYGFWAGAVLGTAIVMRWILRLDPAPKRRWFRFSLRTLLAAVSVFAVLLGWVVWRLDRANHDQRVMAHLSSISTVSYDMPRSSPEWLKTIWVMQHFSSVDGLEFGWDVPHMPQEVLKDHLVRLPRLEKLKIKSDAVTDDGLKPLLGMKRLRILGIASSQLTDGGLLTLGEMKQLQVLAVESPNLTAEGIKRLKRDLPNCQIKSFEMIDVVFDE